jgi:hypothetical protein
LLYDLASHSTQTQKKASALVIMGVSSGIKVLHSVKGLRQGELVLIARGWTEAQEIPPIVVVDVSNILYGLDMEIKAAAEYLADLAATGLTIRPEMMEWLEL